MREFVMPRLSLSDEEEMVVAKWLCEEGGQFEEGDPLLERYFRMLLLFACLGLCC